MKKILNAVFFRLRPFLAGGVVALFAGCASVPQSAPPRAAVVAQPLQHLDIKPDANESEILADLLGGELALADADPETAVQRYVDAAQTSEDPAIAERAVHIAIASRQWPSAQTALSRWQALHGEEIGVRQASAILALHAGQIDAACADLAWLARRPRGSGWLAVSQALATAEDRRQAGLVFERLLREDGAAPAKNVRAVDLGDDPQLWIGVGQLAQKLDRGDIAATLATRAVERFHTPETYAWAAQVRLARGDKDGALEMFSEALRNAQLVPGKAGSDAQTRLRIAYAALLGDVGDNARAEAVLAQGAQNDRTFAARAAYLARGEAGANKAQVESLYGQVLAQPPPRPPARLLLLGQLSEIAERKADALKWYAQIGEDDDEWLAAQQRSAIVLDDLGRTGEAMNLLHGLEARVADDNGVLGEVFLLEAELAGAKGRRVADAIAVYDRGLSMLPDDTRLLYARALACEDVNRTEDAVRDLRRVLALKPDDADAMNALGYTLADRGSRGDKEIGEALTLIQKALRIKPGEPAIIDSMGWVQYRLGNLDAAVEQLRAAYAKQPDPEIAAHLGEVLWVCGKKDEARRIWQDARKKGGNDKVLLDTIERLTS